MAAKKMGLGKGLDAMIPTKIISDKPVGENQKMDREMVRQF